MRIGSLDFRPGLWPTLITMVLLGILTSLGFWQLDRAKQKRVLLEQYGQQGQEAVFRLDAARESFDGLQYSHVSAHGSYDTRHQFLLDNRIHEGRVGYEVLTPLRLSGSETAVLVNRGWIPLVGNRENLPDPEAPGEMMQILGRLKLPTETAFTLAEPEPRKRWPYRIQQVRIDALEKELGYPLMPVLILLDPQQDHGFVRDWRPVTFGPERNTGYAVQWFGLAMALLIIYLVVNTKKVES